MTQQEERRREILNIISQEKITTASLKVLIEFLRGRACLDAEEAKDVFLKMEIIIQNTPSDQEECKLACRVLGVLMFFSEMEEFNIFLYQEMKRMIDETDMEKDEQKAGCLVNELVWSENVLPESYRHDFLDYALENYGKRWPKWMVLYGRFFPLWKRRKEFQALMEKVKARLKE